MTRTLKPDPSKRHKQAGKYLMVQHGPLKGTSVKVVDYVQNQFQGKSIKALRERPDLSPEIDALKGRGHEFTEQTVFAIIPETPPRYILMDDTELQIEAPKTKLTSIDGGKDDSGRTIETDSGEAGVSNGLEGRSVPGGEESGESEGESSSEGQADSEVGSGSGSDEEPVSRPDEREVSTGAETPQSSGATNKPAKQRGNRGTGSK